MNNNDDVESIIIFEINKGVDLLATPDQSFTIYPSAGEICFCLERERQWVYEMMAKPKEWRNRIAEECGQYDCDEVMTLFSQLYAQRQWDFWSGYCWPWRGFSIKAYDRIYERFGAPLHTICVDEEHWGMPYNFSHKIEDNWGVVYYQELPQDIVFSLEADGETDVSEKRIIHYRKMFLNQNGYPDSPEWFEKKFGSLYRLRFDSPYALNDQERKMISRMKPGPNVSSFNAARFGYTILISAALIFLPALCVVGGLLLPYLITQMGRPSRKR